MSSTSSVLSLRDFGVAFGDRVVLHAVNMELSGPGVTVLMGPVGTGKSTLLRTIAGINHSSPSFRSWGYARSPGNLYGMQRAPALVSQNAKLMMSTVLENIICELPDRHRLTIAAKRETGRGMLIDAGLECLVDSLDLAAIELPLPVQRHLAIARTVASDPLLLCIDEPTANLEWEESLPILHFIREQGKKRCVLVVSHNQRDARLLGGHTALLAGGAIQSFAPSDQFFEKPSSSLAADFVRTGSCALPSPNAKAEDVDEAMLPLLPVLPEIAKTYVRGALGPRGFLWLKKGVLAGTPRPGILQDINHDIAALRRVGVTVLISLTTKAVDASLLNKHGIRGIWMPIKDMHAPTMEAAETMCRQVSGLLSQGHVAAYHCHAGLGRTGTMLAAHLIMEGKSALQALESVRRIDHRWVQSGVQEKFLEQFSVWLLSQQENRPMGRY